MSREWLEDPVVRKIKRHCLKRGNNGIRELVNFFRSFDKNADATLSPDEFKTGLKGFGMEMTPYELKHLVMGFDKNGDGRVTLAEFILGLCSGLPARRRAVVMRAFNKFDRDGDQNVQLEQLLSFYDPRRHPLVITGEMPEEEARINFDSYFNLDTNPEGIITREEFLAYYAGVSNNIDDDEYFEDLVCGIWDLEDVEPPPDASFGTVAQRFKQRRQGPSFGASQRDLRMSSQRPAVPTAELQACYASYSAGTRDYNRDHVRTGVAGGSLMDSTAATGKGPRLGAEFCQYETTSAATYKPPSGAARQFAKPNGFLEAVGGAGKVAAPSSKVLPTTGNPTVDLVRQKVWKRAGKGGFRGLTRVLRILDDNGNRKLDKYELTNGLMTYGIEVTSKDMDDVMAYIDRDGSGQVSITEFIAAIRGPMNQRRVEMVQMAYCLLDKNGDERVTFDELRKLYDVAKHPDVVSRERTPVQVLQEFIAGWDKSADGIITFAEFLDYYQDISAGIDDDEYFELMMRNAWHISGGEGKAANTSCRRVLVVHLDGTQSVEQIINDLGIGPNDIDAMRENLASQGITDIKKISLTA